jgi:tetratricopeptide (TPR) repeat protein
MNSRKVLIILALFVAASSVGARAQAGRANVNAKAGGAKTEKAAAATTANMARFDALRSEGFDALYNLDYEGARRRFKEIVRLYPDHPAGPQFLAATLWLQTLNESRRLQASLYNTEAFYAKDKQKTDPATVTTFRELTDAAKALAKARHTRDPNDAEALYYLGAIEGLKAAFAGAVERSFTSALSDGRESVSRHREVLKLDPKYHDAEITIGMYEYVVATLPLPVKIIASIGGMRGSKKKGLEILERVAREGRFARDDAKVLLIALYKREGRFAEALAVARELATKYPRNYLFKLEAADALVSLAAAERAKDPQGAQGAEREAFAIFDTLLQKPSKGEPARPLDLIHFSYGQALAVAGQNERAAKEYLAGSSVPGAEAGLATMSLLRAAQALDLAGKRDDALSQYKAVLARPNIYDSHEEAKRGLREPFKPSERGAQEAAEAEAKTATGQE